jgi:hypothetical protein
MSAASARQERGSESAQGDGAHGRGADRVLVAEEGSELHVRFVHALHHPPPLSLTQRADAISGHVTLQRSTTPRRERCA